MIALRACSQIKENGQPCGATPMRDSEFCFWHHPGFRQEAAEARRLGGLRRREGALEGAYDFPGLKNVTDIRRYLEIAALDLLGLENSISRANAMARIA